MSDQMSIIPFKKLLTWMFEEFSQHGEIFGISENHFFKTNTSTTLSLLEEKIETPLGPAAGPHTQLTQNLVAAYLTGGRFFELKTVQILDELEIDKPCIDARDEGYNVEWSQELRLHQSYEEYVKAWFILHLLKEVLSLSSSQERSFIFNMSVGYDLKGIQTEPMNNFINELKDASQNKVFDQCRDELNTFLKEAATIKILQGKFAKTDEEISQMQQLGENISPYISGSMTLSTMHGCPPDEIEAICKYLLKEKQLHTYVKLNPTLLGFEIVSQILKNQGYNYIQMDPSAFDHDLQYKDAIPMLERLQQFADKQGKQFGVKLSNTLGVANPGQPMAGEQMYMSGRALFPLTINLAAKLANEFSGKLKISYSGGANFFNIEQILETGIYPITLATDLLKPGGYGRLFELAVKADKSISDINKRADLNVDALKTLAKDALTNPLYHKSRHEVDSLKVRSKLEKFDCFVSPCQEACPIHQDIPEYIRLMEENRPVEAFETIICKNPLPHMTGYICDHQCMSKCVRWDYEGPVHIRDIKKAAAENGFSEYFNQFKKNYQQQKSGIQAAVIGAGPAGLAAAYFLTKAGFEVTVFEKEEKAGGTVQHVIPDFRLTREAINNDIEFIEAHGVKFQFGHPADFSIKELKRSGYKYIFIGIGAMKYSRLSIDGDTSQVLNAVEFLRAFKQDPEMDLGKNIAVIGGGNSAMDGARAALRCKGAEKVSIIYRRTLEYMPADIEEVEMSIAENIEFKELLLPVKHQGGILNCQVMELGETDTDGRRKVHPVSGKFVEIPVDTVISAIGEKVDIDLLFKNGLLPNEQSALKIDLQTGESMVENVYIGGDAGRGPATVVEAIADGKKVAEAICQKENLPENIFKAGNNINKTNWQADIRLRKPNQSLIEEFQIKSETSRCLGCKYLCNKCVDVCPNRANIAIAVDGEFENSYQILHVDEMCNECGNCETFCPHSGAPYKDKTTLFHSEEVFHASHNDGFLLTGKLLPHTNNFHYKIRFQGQVGLMTYTPTLNTFHSSLEFTDEEFSKFKMLMVRVLEDYHYLLK
jgi:putative selenate reductase